MRITDENGSELCCPEISHSDDGIDNAVYLREDRPFVHFTAARGWTNDPNGLVRQNGIYHMFFQHNPVSVQWGNMHRGHAVSEDLLHWTERDDALYPDEHGTVYSGSALIDHEGIAGCGKGTMLLYYTAAGSGSLMSAGKPATQCLALSRDGGESFEHYAGNPVIGHIEGENRDPKIVYAEELKAYLLALYLNDDRYALFKSTDLLHFEHFQTLSLPGDNECPDIYPITADDGVRRWIFSGAHHCYFTGALTDSGFIANANANANANVKANVNANDQANVNAISLAKRLHFGGNSYASQTFSDMPYGSSFRFTE